MEVEEPGTDKGLEREVLPSPFLCGSKRPSQALAPFLPEAAGREEAAREQARHQPLKSSWGGGMAHLLEPDEAVGGSPS